MTQTQRIRAGGVAAACLAMAAQLFLLIDRHAVNVLFWDQWDFLRGLREGASQWQLFSWIHGPHRMGLGYFFIEAVYRASHWDTRAEAFATGGLYLVVLVLALLLKRKAAGPFTLLDVCIPALVLTRTQFEIFIGTPNAAHGAIPLLLAVAAPFVWRVTSAPLRAALGGLLAFCAAYTGFAMFLVPALALLFALEAIRPAEPRARLWPALGALLCAAALASFLVHYRFESAVACYAFPDARPLRYLPFAGLVLIRPFRIGHLIPGAAFVGTLAALVAIAFTAWAAVQAARSDRGWLSRATFLFSSFSLLFAADAAVGRVCLGLGDAFASRYVPYVVPFWLALYMVLAREVSRRPRLKAPAGAVAAFVLILQLTMPNDASSLRHFSEGKRRWRDCYLATRDEAGCNASTQFKVYPTAGAPQVAQMLDYLREHHLNLYK